MFSWQKKQERHSFPTFVSDIHFRHSFPTFISDIHFRRSFPTFISDIHFRHSFPTFISDIHFRHSFPTFISDIRFRHSFPTFIFKTIFVVKEPLVFQKKKYKKRGAQKKCYRSPSYDTVAPVGLLFFLSYRKHFLPQVL